MINFIEEITVHGPGVLAFDGERERVLKPGQRAMMSLSRSGPWVVDVGKTLQLAAEKGYDIEVIDLKSLLPFDGEMLVKSACKTGRVVIIHEAPQTLGFGAEIAAVIQAKAFGYLEAPIDRITAPDVPYSYRRGDEYYIPNKARIRAGILKTLENPF